LESTVPSRLCVAAYKYFFPSSSGLVTLMFLTLRNNHNHFLRSSLFYTPLRCNFPHCSTSNTLQLDGRERARDKGMCDAIVILGVPLIYALQSVQTKAVGWNIMQSMVDERGEILKSVLVHFEDAKGELTIYNLVRHSHFSAIAIGRFVEQGGREEDIAGYGWSLDMSFPENSFRTWYTTERSLWEIKNQDLPTLEAWMLLDKLNDHLNNEPRKALKLTACGALSLWQKWIPHMRLDGADAMLSPSERRRVIFCTGDRLRLLIGKSKSCVSFCLSSRCLTSSRTTAWPLLANKDSQF
jgi:hypothetical protein